MFRFIAVTGLEGQVIGDGTQRQRGEEREGRNDDDDGEGHQREGSRVGAERAGALGNALLRRQQSGYGDLSHDREVAAHDQGDARRDVPERRVVGQSLESRAVVGRRGGVFVEHFAQSVERGVVQPPYFGVRGGHGGRDARADEDQEGMQQHDQRGDLHLARLDFPAEELRRAAHHQSADEDGDDEECEIVHPPYSHAAEPAVDLHVEHLEHAAQRGLRIVHRVDRTVRRDGGRHAPHGRCGRADADLLALHRTELLRDAHAVDLPAAARLLPDGEDDACGIGQEHHAENPCREPASARVEPEGEDHRHGQNQDRPAFEDVGEGVGVFERVRRVGSEVAAAVGSQLFDGHDGCGGALRDDLFGAFERRERLLAVEGHRRAVDDEQDADGERQRQQDARHAPGEEDPEVADGLLRFARQRLHHSGHGGHAAGGGDELEEHDDEQLREVGQARLAAVMLEVAVDHERDAGVERQVGRLSRVAVGVERQPALEDQQQHAPEEPEEVDRQERFEELFPVHLHGRVDAAEAVDGPFDGSHEVEPRAFAAVDFGNVTPQRVAERHQKGPLQDYA